MKSTILAFLIAITLLPTSSHAERKRRLHKADKAEDRRDAREDKRDIREDERDAKHVGGMLDKSEDRLDAIEDKRDGNEDKREARRESRKEANRAKKRVK